MTTERRFAIPADPERISIARSLLHATSGFGVVVAILDYLAGEMFVVAMTIGMIVLIQAILVLARRMEKPAMPLYFAIALNVGLFVFGNFTELDHPDILVWVNVYPFLFYHLTGPRTGTLLCAVGFAQLLVAYLAYPFIHARPPVSASAFIQLAMAYVFCAILAYLYERMRSRQKAELKAMAEIDFLTGVANRRGFCLVADALLDQAKRFRQPFSVVMFDLDFFKRVNDTHGHQVGDLLLKEVTALARQHLRQADRLARWGGEEFVVLLPHTDLEGAYIWAEKLRCAIGARAFPVVGRITASFGLSAVEGGAQLDDIIRQADDALYVAKKQGRDRVEPTPSTAMPYAPMAGAMVR